MISWCTAYCLLLRKVHADSGRNESPLERVDVNILSDPSTDLLASPTPVVSIPTTVPDATPLSLPSSGNARRMPLNHSPDYNEDLDKVIREAQQMVS